jgi:hypothetical protein
MTTAVLSTGETTYADHYGPTGSRVFHIRIDRHHDGVAITIAHHDILNRAFPSPAEADAYLDMLKAQAEAGTTAMWAIEDMAGAWTTAAAIVDEAERELAEQINATMDAAKPQPVDVSDIVDDIPVGGSWDALRRNARRDYSRTRVGCKPPTEPELGRIRAARRNDDGTLTVTRAPGQPWSVLKGLHDRLGGVPAYRAGTARVIDTLTFPAEQLADYLTEELVA